MDFGIRTIFGTDFLSVIFIYDIRTLLWEGGDEILTKILYKMFYRSKFDPECSRGLSFSYGGIRMADLSFADSIEPTTRLL